MRSSLSTALCIKLNMKFSTAIIHGDLCAVEYWFLIKLFPVLAGSVPTCRRHFDALIAISTRGCFVV